MGDILVWLLYLVRNSEQQKNGSKTGKRCLSMKGCKTIQLVLSDIDDGLDLTHSRFNLFFSWSDLQLSNLVTFSQKVLKKCSVKGQIVNALGFVS